MSAAFSYETFIRKAFGYKINGGLVGRWGDPAALANTDLFSDSSIDKVKVAVGYAMEILTTEIANNEKIQSDAEYLRIDGFVNRVITANAIIDISAIIEEYQTTVIDKYYDINNGIMSLK